PRRALRCRGRGWPPDSEVRPHGVGPDSGFEVTQQGWPGAQVCRVGPLGIVELVGPIGRRWRSLLPPAPGQVEEELIPGKLGGKAKARRDLAAVPAGRVVELPGVFELDQVADLLDLRGRI